MRQLVPVELELGGGHARRRPSPPPPAAGPERRSPSGGPAIVPRRRGSDGEALGGEEGLGEPAAVLRAVDPRASGAGPTGGQPVLRQALVPRVGAAFVAGIRAVVGAGVVGTGGRCRHQTRSGVAGVPGEEDALPVRAARRRLPPAPATAPSAAPTASSSAASTACAAVRGRLRDVRGAVVRLLPGSSAVHGGGPGVVGWVVGGGDGAWGA
mmetsp:Transcript_13127/g.25075  ORF Transcript_13127/g.25075 Transcript_13127/m.25075 type:complete len:211 (+) Transcript_13127:968-1600(+)